MMRALDNGAIAVFLLASIILLPAYYLACTIYLYRTASEGSLRPKSNKAKLCKTLLKSMSLVKPWLMVDVFLIGVLVSLIKIAAMAEVTMGVSFWAFCAYTALVVRALSMIDVYWLWDHLFPNAAVMASQVDDFQHDGHQACHVCGLVELANSRSHKCSRCQSTLHPFDAERSLNLAWALLVTSAIFYIPANLYPMMYTSAFGSTEGSTILEASSSFGIWVLTR